MTKSEDNGICIDPRDTVTVTVMNHLVEVQHMLHSNYRQHIQKIDKDRYYNIHTGEIGFYEKSVTRQDNINSLRQTFKKLRYLINNNFIGDSNELHVTLTYKENMTCRERLMKDFDVFMKRLRYEFKTVSKIEYVNVVEPQGRGAWHCHLLLKFVDVENIFIQNSLLAEIWSNGFVGIKALKGIDNIGAYLSAYLSDIDVTGEEEKLRDVEVEVKIVDGVPKKFIKGGRLNLYPPGMRIYRKSTGMKYPIRTKIQYKDIKKIVGSVEPHYLHKVEIETDSFSNEISYIQYNLNREK